MDPQTRLRAPGWRSGNFPSFLFSLTPPLPLPPHTLLPELDFTRGATSVSFFLLFPSSFFENFTEDIQGLEMSPSRLPSSLSLPLLFSSLPKSSSLLPPPSLPFAPYFPSPFPSPRPESDAAEFLLQQMMMSCFMGRASKEREFDCYLNRFPLPLIYGRESCACGVGAGLRAREICERFTAREGIRASFTRFPFRVERLPWLRSSSPFSPFFSVLRAIFRHFPPFVCGILPFSHLRRLPFFPSSTSSHLPT